MGFLDIFSSHANTQQSQSTSSYVNTTNTSVQGGDGVTLSNARDNVITTTDFGAVQAGRDIAESGLDAARAGFDAATDISSDALSLGRDAISGGNDVAIAGLDHAAQAYGTSLDFAGDTVARALDSNNDLATRALNAVSDASANVLDWASGLFESAVTSNQRTLDTTTDAVSKLAQQVSANEGDRSVKVALYAVLAVAGVVVLPAILGGRK